MSEAADRLAEQRFSSASAPSDWILSGATFTVSTTGHTYADLSALEDVVLRIDYGFKT